MNETTATPAPARTKASPATRYMIRMGVGIALYVITLFIAVAMQDSGVGTWQPMLLTLPSVAIIAWAVIAFYRESDEFAQRQLGESFIIGFAIGVPLLLVVGLLEMFHGPHLNWMFAFGIMMAGWSVGSIITSIRYRK